MFIHREVAQSPHFALENGAGQIAHGPALHMYIHQLCVGRIRLWIIGARFRQASLLSLHGGNRGEAGGLKSLAGADFQQCLKLRGIADLQIHTLGGPKCHPVYIEGRTGRAINIDHPQDQIVGWIARLIP